MPRLLRLFAHLLLTCGLVQTSWAQQAPNFDLQATWLAALRVAGEPLVLPAAQRGIQFCQTSAYYQGQQYLLQRLHYDWHERLDTASYYYLARQDGQLHSQLSKQTIYYTQVRGDSLVSQVTTLYPSPTSPLVTRPRLLHGNIPPVEPLLGEGAAAHQALLLGAGTLHELDQRPGVDPITTGARWQWGVVGSGSRQQASLFERHSGLPGYSQQATLDCQARTLSVVASQSGSTWRFTRSYLGSGQDYEEHADQTMTGAGQGTLIIGELYMRRVHYVKGLCCNEYFTVLALVPAGSAPPEFEVRHQYIFYSAKRTRHFKS